MSTSESHLTASKLCAIGNKVSTIQTELCTKLASKAKSPVTFNKVTPQSIADCSPLYKIYLAKQLIDLINMLEPLSKCSITLQHSEILDIDKIEHAMSKCITKELNDLHNSNEFNIKSVRDDIKKLDTLVTEINASINSSAETINLLPSNTLNENRPPVPKSVVDITNPTEHIDHYKTNFISEQVESELLDFLQKQDFVQIRGRSVLDFGEPYGYTGSPYTQNAPDPIPEPIKGLMDDIRSKFPKNDINQCTINKYCDNSSYLPEHSDDEPTIKPESSIFTVSLGSQRDIIFRDAATGGERIVTPESRSLYAMSHPSQFLWTHRIDTVDSGDIKPIVRYSLTFRCVSTKYLKSTIIIGDSNTRHLKFGEGEGTFGRNIPGKRVEAFKVDDINPIDCCGYSKIFIHCGINDIKQDSITGPAKVAACFRNLRDNVDKIKLICPKSRVYVSPILPTKDRALNERCLYFNRLLFDFVHESVGGILSHDFGIFCNSDGLLSNEMGLYKNPFDKLHIGSNGIHELVKIIRTCVYGTLTKKSVKSGKPYATAVIDGAPRRRPQR